MSRRVRELCHIIPELNALHTAGEISEGGTREKGRGSNGRRTDGEGFSNNLSRMLLLLPAYLLPSFHAAAADAGSSSPTHTLAILVLDLFLSVCVGSIINVEFRAKCA